MAQGLASRIRREGGTPWLLPAMEIRPPADEARARRLLAWPGAYGMVIFISPTAVRRGLQLAGPWPKALRIFAVGGGTRAELARHGLDATGPDAGADSEALLQLPELRDVAGTRALLVCGEGGRDLLAETLVARGAQVERVECYRRVLPERAPAPALAAWSSGAIHAATVYSSESLANLFTLLGEREAARLRATPFFVPHARVAEAARRRGVAEVQVAGPSDEEVLARLVAYFDVP